MLYTTRYVKNNFYFIKILEEERNREKEIERERKREISFKFKLDSVISKSRGREIEGQVYPRLKSDSFDKSFPKRK